MSKLKDQISREFSTRRRSLSDEAVVHASISVGRLIGDQAEFKSAHRIMLYLSFNHELDTGHWIEEWLRQGKELFVPAIFPEETKILPAPLHAHEQLKIGPLGIPTPTTHNYLDPRELDLVIVPGLAFGKAGERIGFGKGYYDRFLKHTNATRLAVAYDFQVLPTLPQGEMDVPMDLLITPSQVLKFPENYRIWRDS